MKAHRKVTANTPTSSMDNQFARLLFATPVGILIFAAAFSVFCLIMMKLKFEPSEFEGAEQFAALFFGGVGALVGCFLWWFVRSVSYVEEGKNTICPSCKQWFSAVEVASDVFTTGKGKAKVYSPKAIRSVRTGLPVGYIDDYDDVDTIGVGKLTHWKCKRCGNTWLTHDHENIAV